MCGILMYRSRRNIGKIIHSQDLCRMKSSGNELTFQIYVNPELNKYISHYDLIDDVKQCNIQIFIH